MGRHVNLDGNISTDDDTNDGDFFLSDRESNGKNADDASVSTGTGGANYYEEDGDDVTSLGTTNHDTSQKQMELKRSSALREKQLAAKEDRAVRRIKYVVIACLAIITVAVALAAYFFSSAGEEDDFEKQYREDAQKLINEIYKNIQLTLMSSDAFTVSITSLAAATGQEWPFVVVPDFAVRAEKIRALASAVLVNIYPVVTDEQREQWESYTAEVGPVWVNESIEAIAGYDKIDYWPIVTNYTLCNVIHDYDTMDDCYDGGAGRGNYSNYLPMWQSQPTIAYEPPYNWDLNSVPLTGIQTRSAHQQVLDTCKAVLTEAYLISYENDTDSIENDKEEAEWISSYIPADQNPMEPISDIFYPIFADSHTMIDYNYTESCDVAGIFSVSIYWRDMISGILADGSNGFIIVFENPCSPTFTYEINGPEANFLGPGDLHDPQYDDLKIIRDSTTYSTRVQEESAYDGVPIDTSFCPWGISVYPSEKYEDSHTTMTPVYFSLITVVIFAVTALAFMLYDVWVERRQKVVMDTAVKTTKLVSTLFPDQVVAQMMDDDQNSVNDSGRDAPSGAFSVANSNPSKMKSALNESGTGKDTIMNSTIHKSNRHGSNLGKSKRSKPIAELFPDTTVFFADIAGFTSWSSEREPSAVFTLLETIYGAFDKLAKKYGIFKVETIGDSYVAVCGLPDPNKNHAIAMSRFAFETLRVMKIETRELELELGPGTADLALRVGLHSGPTIAGVLRGEKARFQLFGDTVNTAARMESNGTPNKIQVSQKTADLIIAAGKRNWLTKREDLVDAKGKGKLQTYWLNRKRCGSRDMSSMGSLSLRPGSSALSSVRKGSDLTSSAKATETIREDEDALPQAITTVTDGTIQRLIDWNVSIFKELLEEIVAHRVLNSKAMSVKHLNQSRSSAAPKTVEKYRKWSKDQPQPFQINEEMMSKPGKHVRDEVIEAISMPSYNDQTSSLASSQKIDTSNVKLDVKVVKQLREYITKIASYYHSENGFHNFQHASHVIMSTVKLLQRIATPDAKKKDCLTEKDYFDYTFGITHDPLTKFSIVFSALIHDVDHQGVSNFQLSKESDPMAVAYENKSVLEQHSFDLAWSLLSEMDFKDLRKCIFTTRDEYNRFRQLTINCVIATDIFDKEMKQFREGRWEKAFRSNSNGEGTVNDWNRKATITIECIIQASDVAHTMQHWHVYQKWNKMLFNEMYSAYKNGRADKDPSLGWYNGEIWFFDNYIIPLAKKLRECEVFGVSCDEFLNFATENRTEWALKGHDIVAEMLNNFKEQASKKKSDEEDDL